MSNGHEHGRLFGGVKPIGNLGETLKRYEAPEDVQRRIARRAGGLIGREIPVQKVEKTIQESMQVGGDGMPKWPLVEQSMSNIAHRIYHGHKQV